MTTTAPKIKTVIMTSSWHAKGPREYELILDTGERIPWVGSPVPKAGETFNKKEEAK